MIGFNETTIHSVLLEILARCRKKHPGLQLELSELITCEQLDMLRRGRLDIGLMCPFGFDLSGLESKLISRGKYLLVMPEDHRLACWNEIDAEKLSGEDIILIPREFNPAVYDLKTAALTSSQAEPPHFRQYARSGTSMLAMVKAGFGVALVTESRFRDPLPGLTSREVRAQLPPVDILAVWDPDRLTGALESFISLL